MSERQAAEKITPEQFFDEIVPQILIATANTRVNVEGVCEIHLFGETRSAWTINLKAGTVQQGGTKDPDLYLEMDRGDFQAMMMNRLDIERAIRGGRVRFEGKLPLLADLGEILEPRSMEY
ncbi:MAG: SCP2 sterol-binding domain-containing protein [Myxococcaceae bacterium]|nr:SCP2 sterol-binding domain-containing protein [Myxococcaceae bacterium]